MVLKIKTKIGAFLKSMIKRLINFILNKTTPDETIRESKEKWTKLAKKNAKYFIYSDTENQSDEEFRMSGQGDFERHILNDSFLQNRLKKIGPVRHS